MFEKLRTRILEYVYDNLEDLLNLDLKVARILGAPAPHTLSSYAFLEVNWFWKYFHRVTDALFKWLLGQENHCETDYKRVAQLAEQQSPKL